MVHMAVTAQICQILGFPAKHRTVSSTAPLLPVQAAVHVRTCIEMLHCGCTLLQHGLCLKDIAIVEPRLSSEETEASMAADSEPRHCVLLRAGGQMSMLDMAQGLPCHSHNIPAIKSQHNHGGVIVSCALLHAERSWVWLSCVGAHVVAACTVHVP